MPPTLHGLIRAGDLAGVQAALDRSSGGVDVCDRHGHTPLMSAVTSAQASVDLTALLIENGASVNAISQARYEQGRSVLSLAIRGGDPGKVALLIEHGADVLYSHSGGYDALLDVPYSADVEGNPRLVDLLKLLIANGAALNTVSSYNEAALSGLSCSGRFDAVQVLLDAGADPGRLEWTALHRAVALGSGEDVRDALDRGADIELRDRRKRTPFLLAVQTGDVAKAEMLVQRGANLRAAGHCGAPALFFAIENPHDAMLDWLLRHGADIEQTDEFGDTPLMTAAEHRNSYAVRALLSRGAKLEAQRRGETALALAGSRDVIVQLLDGGADPRQLVCGGQRLLIGFGETSEDPLLDISVDQFRSGRSRRFGNANPEPIEEPFWEAMIRAGLSGYEGAQICNSSNTTHPVWCANRFGQSLTRLPNGRVIQIGGEHEDSYDEDFCIYNDVFVHYPGGAIKIFGYPPDVFPPTDFHSATLMGQYIYIIGALGYSGTRLFHQTPMYRLNTDTFSLEQLHASGQAPGWIYGHRASQLSAHEICVAGGTIAVDKGSSEEHLPHDHAFVLNTQTLTWRRRD